MATKKRKFPFLRLLVVVIVILVAIFGIYMYIFQAGGPLSKASQEGVVISFSTSTLAPNASQTVNINIAPATAGKVISGFEILFSPTPGLTLQSIGDPILLPNAASSGLVQLVKNSRRIAYVINAPDNQLPSLVSIPVTVQTGKNVKIGAKLSLRLSVRATGPVAGYSYAVGKNNSKEFTVAVVAPTQ